MPNTSNNFKGNSALKKPVQYSRLRLQVSLIRLNAFEFVNHGPAGDLSLPNAGCVVFWLHIVQTVEKMEEQ